MNELSPEFTRQVLHLAMRQEVLLRAAELSNWGWTRGTPSGAPGIRRARSRSPQATAWSVVGAVDRALYELLNLDVL